MKTPRYSWEKEMMLDRGWCENFQCICSISCKKCGFIASGPVWICSKICILCFFYFAFAFCVFYFVFLSCILTGKDCHRISDDESQVATGGQDLPKSDFCHFQHTICNFLTTYHCPPLVWGFILRLQFTTSSRRLDGGAYCGAPVGGKCMVSKVKLVLYAFAV